MTMTYRFRLLFSLSPCLALHRWARLFYAMNNKNNDKQGFLFDEPIKKIEPARITATFDDIRKSYESCKKEGKVLICKIEGKRDKRMILGTDDRNSFVAERVVIKGVRLYRSGMPEYWKPEQVLWVDRFKPTKFDKL